jgi:hypothetical protein
MIRSGIAAALIATAGAVAAQDASPDWTGKVTLYGWFAGIDGDITAPATGATGSVSLSPGDVLDRLDTGLFGHAEVSRGRFGVLFDGAYIELSDSQTVSAPVPGSVDGETTLTMVHAAGFYRAVEAEKGFVDVYGGARLVDLDLALRATAAGGGPGVAGSADETWVDPIIGVRGAVAMTDRVTLTGLVDIGGFGVGSEFSYHIFTGVSVRVWERVSAEAGFRYLSIDYEADRVDFDGRFWGPTLGLSIGF